MEKLIFLSLVIVHSAAQNILTNRTTLYGIYNNGKNSRHMLGIWLTSGCSSDVCNTTVRSTEAELPGYDGWYNNLDRPDSGAIDGHLLRRWPAAYEDGTYAPSGSSRPNPFQLSDDLLAGPIGSASRTGKNALLVFFGQQVVEEILDAQRAACPPEYFNIPIPDNHKFRKYHKEMPFLRTRYDQRTGYTPNNPRQQLNEITPYLDGGLMYGITKQWSDQLRTYSNGTIDPDGLLAYSHDGLFPEYNKQRLPLANPPPPFHHAEFIEKHEIAKVDRFFMLGNPRGNENTFLLTFGVLWFRWHNYLARSIKRQHRDWTSEKIFNEARKWTIATQQHVVLDEWLPSWLNNPLPPYEGYDPAVNPQIDQFFQAAAFRFGHTLVAPGVYLRDYARRGCKSTISAWGKAAVRTCNSFWRPQDAIKTKINDDELVDIDRVLMGLAVQLCEEEDHKIVEDLRGNVFGPLEFPRRDLMAINIQRGRDHGLPDFNSAREAYGLPKITSFDHFVYATKKVRNRLSALYNGSLNNIDPWVGGILETGDGPGELFEAVILDQFKRIRDGDRFWYNNTKNKLFTMSEIDRIKQLKLYDVIMAVTKMDSDDIQENVFRAPSDFSQINQRCHENLQNSTCKTKNPVTTNYTCIHLPQLNAERLNESCVEGTTYDYFEPSPAPYILTFTAVGAFIVGSLGIVYVLIVLKERKNKAREMEIANKFQSKKQKVGKDEHIYLAKEWQGRKTISKSIVLKLTNNKHINVLTYKGTLLRTIDLNNKNRTLTVYNISDKPFILIRPNNDYDLVLEFESDYLRHQFSVPLKEFLANTTGRHEFVDNQLSNMLASVVTQENRKQKLDMFFRVVFAQAFKIKHSEQELLKVDTNLAREVAHLEITLNEFADVLGMRPQAEFVNRMFYLIDKDKNGFISFREFTDLLIIFSNGTEEHKAKLLFDMYDINAVGYLTQEDFTAMIRSFLETVGGTVEQSHLENTITNMLRAAGLQNKNKLNFEDFKKIVGDDIKKLNKAKLGFKGVPENQYLDRARQTLEEIYQSTDEIQARIQGNKDFSNTIDKVQEDFISKKQKSPPSKYIAGFRYVEKKAAYIFWLCLYTLVLLAIFAERAYYYSVEREHSGLRRIAGYGVTITRGAASAMMFTYSSLLVTMCRNTISHLRDTVLSKYLPLDSMVDFHKYIAYWSLFFTLLHIIGHAFNFYHISTQTADDLTCLFRNYFHATHELPKFHYWCWQTMTGFTGIVLTLICTVIFVFAQTIVRQKLYNWFWYTHSLYPLFYIFMVLHGTGRLIQEPFFHYFFLGPVVLFTIDTIVSVRRKKIQIPVIKAQILPSDVTMLEFSKPENFVHKSGQWIRIACLGLNSNEYHPFTLSSSPDENNLTVHIRAVGPWTRHIRQLYDDTIMSQRHLPMIYLDGPYGESHQDWYQYEVCVLIGGGIGVTPFASILKDIVFKANTNYKFKCKKVYFVWVSRTQKQFEWMVDILRDLEASDKNNVVSAHIFITQFYEKFDLRTILLYICERHYQKIARKSLFTNLQAVTHFGRPSFAEFFKTLQSLHVDVRKVGVFSCGPPSMTTAVEAACFRVNKSTDAGPAFNHSYKNF